MPRNKTRSNQRKRKALEKKAILYNLSGTTTFDGNTSDESRMTFNFPGPDPRIFKKSWCGAVCTDLTPDRFDEMLKYAIKKADEKVDITGG